MTETYSMTQQQYPLSHRKFWKKMLQKFLPWAIVSLVFGLLIGLVFYAGAGEGKGLGAGMYVLITLLAAVVIFVIFFFVPYGLYVHAYIKRYYYSCDENFITIKKGVFAPAEIHVQYSKIQDVYVDQDILDRVLGIYDVHIASATVASGIEAHIDGVGKEAAEGLKHLLLDKIQHYNNPSSGIPAPATTGQIQTLPVTAKLDMPISSTEFPISGKWVAVRIVSSIISATVIVLVFGISVIADIEESTAIGIGVLFGILVLAWAVVGAISAILVVWWKSNYRFEFGPDYITLKQGIFSKEERHVPYKTIQDVRLSQGILDRILGISTVVIENAAVSAGVSASGRGIGSQMRVNNGIVVPGQPLTRGKALVEAVNAITGRITNAATTGL
jgi:putative membrane protein